MGGKTKISFAGMGDSSCNGLPMKDSFNSEERVERNSAVVRKGPQRKAVKVHTKRLARSAGQNFFLDKKDRG